MKHNTSEVDEKGLPIVPLPDHVNPHAIQPDRLDLRPPGFKKHDTGKHDWTKFPWRAADAVMSVMEHGAEKYGWDNWREASGEDINRYMAANLRHCIAEISGHPIDYDSQLLAVHHALCSLMFYVECKMAERERYDEEANEIGERFKQWAGRACPDDLPNCEGPDAEKMCSACWRSGRDLRVP